MSGRGQSSAVVESRGEDVAKHKERRWRSTRKGGGGAPVPPFTSLLPCDARASFGVGFGSNEFDSLNWNRYAKIKIKTKSDKGSFGI